MTAFRKISPLGDRGILIEFEGEIDPETLDKVLFFRKKIENSYLKQEVEVINTYNSLLISCMFAIEDIYNEISSLKSLLGDANIEKKADYRIFKLPVCYDKEFGLDLKYISEEKKLSENEIIELHTAPLYQVYFIGFLPGFLYLGGLDSRLQISRKKTPRRSVEKGSVGIGENQTGIYPKNSPGGWQILGKTPVDLFNKNEKPPSPFSAGDKIKFEAVSREEYLEIEKQIETGNYSLKTVDHES